VKCLHIATVSLLLLLIGDYFRYGLLGPSGCGKTTLLRCVIGRLTVNDGIVLTLGKRPGSVGHRVPGSLVGYMPQVSEGSELFSAIIFKLALVT
jgi:ABC-type cobalamin/Fe3+-siderophores transport system ATPase subunit